MNCTRCDATGFLNIDQVDAEVLEQFDKTGNVDLILGWIADRNAEIDRGDCSCHISPPCGKCVLYHDVQVCDCCGNGEDWHGQPGAHNNFQGKGGAGKEPFPECY